MVRLLRTACGLANRLPHRGAWTLSPQWSDPMACVRKWRTAPTSALVRPTFRFPGGVDVNRVPFLLAKPDGLDLSSETAVGIVLAASL